MKMEPVNSVEFVHAMTGFMESLMDRKAYAEAIKYYESNRSELERVGGAEAAGVLRMAASAYASGSQPTLALRTARLAQHMAAALGDSLILAEVFLTIGGILQDKSELKEAEKAYRDAESLFRRNDNPEGQSRALNFLAGLFFRQNDYKNSLAALMDAIEIARRLNDKKKLAFMMGNIGRIQTFTGDLHKAKLNLRANIDLSRELGDNLEVARAYLSLGYVCIQGAEYVEAAEALDQAYPLIIAGKYRRDEVIYMTYLGELKYRSGLLEESQEILESALALADAIAPDSTLAGRVVRHLAEVHVRLNNVRTAQRLSSASWVIMEKANDRVELGALSKIKAILAERSGDRDESARLYSRAIDQLDETGVRFEKADALVAAGKSEVFSSRQRLTYLFRAEEFYSRFNLPKKREEVERLINQVDDHGTKGATTQPGANAGALQADYVTSSPEIIAFKKQLPLIAQADLPLLLTGETGVGKDHMARYFHQLSRPDSPFIAINCASLPETLLESELFGYRKGAFTGAEANKLGLFVAANSGVLFLDEIGDMPLNLQTKLLGVLENRKVVPLGSTVPVDLDIKLIAATNKNLEEMVEAGTFRRDLYYRLSGVTFEIPPLRKRKEDIPMLLGLFMKKCNLSGHEEAIPADLARQFIEYDWPGNTRELYNKVKRLEVMSQLVAEGDLVELSRSIFDTDMPATANSLFERVEQFERKIILEALLAAQGNKSEAARILGIHEATVRMKLKRYGISLEQFH